VVFHIFIILFRFLEDYADCIILKKTENYAEIDSDEFGLVEDSEVDARIAEAERLSLAPAQIDPNFKIEDPSWTTKLVLDPDSFTADKYVQKAPIISYKHKFETVFRDKPRWKTAKEFE